MNRKTHRCTYRKNRKNRKSNRKSTRRGLAFARRTRRHRGGSFLEALNRPLLATVYPNPLQNTYAGWTGAQPNNYPAPPPPVDKTWTYLTNGAPINPHIAHINTGFAMINSPVQYSPAPLSKY
jgi:hypothetical protein